MNDKQKSKEEPKENNLLKVSREQYGDKYRDHFFEQYRIYVEMADRISARRLIANSFFLTIHTSIIAAMVAIFKDGLKVFEWWMITLLFGVELFCYAWWRIVKSYRQLNSGKYKVVHIMESYLPCSPYDKEWEILGKGENKNLYLPITHIENWVPFSFGLLYILLAILLIAYPINNSHKEKQINSPKSVNSQGQTIQTNSLKTPTKHINK